MNWIWIKRLLKCDVSDLKLEPQQKDDLVISVSDLEFVL